MKDGQRIGYVYWKKGFKEEAEYYFNEHIKQCNSEIELAGDAPT